MSNPGTIKPSISIQVDLWNEIQKVISEDGITISRFLQSSARLKLKFRKIQNVREFLDIIDEKEMDILKKEIKKRGN